VRQLLLFGAKREATLDLWEVQRYGAESYGDTDHVSVYGMRPAEWYARGIRLLGRTAVECTRDVLADAIAMDVAALAGSAPSASGTRDRPVRRVGKHALYWIMRRLPGARVRAGLAGRAGITLRLVGAPPLRPEPGRAEPRSPPRHPRLGATLSVGACRALWR
jgi:hypothetical protein